MADGVPRPPDAWDASLWSPWPAVNQSESAGTAWGTADPPDPFLEFTPEGRGVAKESYRRDICEAWDAYQRRGPLQQRRFNGFGYLC